MTLLLSGYTFTIKLMAKIYKISKHYNNRCFVAKITQVKVEICALVVLLVLVSSSCFHSQQKISLVVYRISKLFYENDNTDQLCRTTKD